MAQRRRRPRALLSGMLPTGTQELISALREAELGVSASGFVLHGIATSGKTARLHGHPSLSFCAEPGRSYIKPRQRNLPRVLPSLPVGTPRTSHSAEDLPGRAYIGAGGSGGGINSDEEQEEELRPEMLEMFARHLAETDLNDLYALLHSMPPSEARARRLSRFIPLAQQQPSYGRDLQYRQPRGAEATGQARTSLGGKGPSPPPAQQQQQSMISAAPVPDPAILDYQALSEVRRRTAAGAAAVPGAALDKPKLLQKQRMNWGKRAASGGAQGLPLQTNNGTTPSLVVALPTEAHAGQALAPAQQNPSLLAQPQCISKPGEGSTAHKPEIARGGGAGNEDSEDEEDDDDEDADLQRQQKWVKRFEQQIEKQLQQSAKAIEASEQQCLEALRMAERMLAGETDEQPPKHKKKRKKRRKPDWKKSPAFLRLTEREKAAAILLSFYERVLLYCRGRAFEVWWSYVQSKIDEMHERAAVRFQCAVRGWLAKRLALHKRREVAAVSFAQRREEVWARTGKAALLIQRVWRAFVFGRRIAHALRMRDWAAGCIQNYVRSTKARWETKLKVLARRRALRALPKFQAIYRGHMARRRLGLRRVCAVHERHLARYDSYNEVVKMNFEQQGAATIMQIWWRARDEPPVSKAEILMKAVRKVVRRSARSSTTIQALIRGFLARRRVLIIRRQRQKARALLRRLKSLAWTMIGLKACAQMLKEQSREAVPVDRRWQTLVAQSLKVNPKAAAAAGVRSILSMSPTSLKKMLGMDQTVSSTTTASKKEGDAEDSQRMKLQRKEERALMAVQRALRRFLAARERHRLQALRSTCRAIKARQSCRQLLRRWRARRRLKAEELEAWELLQRKVKAATILQRYVRRFRARRRAALCRIAEPKLRLFLQTRSRGILTRLAYDRMRTLAVAKEELKIAGAMQFNVTVERANMSQVLSMLSINDPGADSELQMIFLWYTSTKGRTKVEMDSGPLEMDLSRWLRFTRDFNLHNSQLYDARALYVEMLKKYEDDDYTRQATVMTFQPLFVRALQQLADVRLDNVEEYGRHTGAEARLLKFIIEDLYESAMGRKLLSSLLEQDTYASRAHARLASHVGLIQRAYRGSFVRRLVAEAKREKRRQVEYERMIKAVTSIQSTWRRHRVRQVVQRLAKDMYECCIDSTTGYVYYYNPRTGRATWTKPQLLGRPTDIKNPIYIPEADRALSVPCCVCKTRTALHYCVDCTDYYCTQDHWMVHRKGKNATHTSMAVDICVQCGTQVATRTCHKCLDFYCDTCYYALHKAGQMAWHTWKAISPMCTTCVSYVAQRHCDTCGLNLCIRCANNDKHEELHTVSPLTYKPASILHQEREQLEKEKQAAIREVHEKRQGFLRERKQRAASLVIQRVWRGYRARKPYRHMLNHRERAVQRRQEANYRDTWTYQVQFWLGLAPVLMSDSVQMKVLKRFPIWLHAFVAEAVGQEWLVAYDEAIEQEQFLQRNPAWRRNAPLLCESLWLLRLSIRWAVTEMRINLAKQFIHICTRRVITLKSKMKKDAVRQIIKRLRKDVARVETGFASIQAEKDKVMEKRQSRNGPDRMNKRLEFHKRYGIAMPFWLGVRKGTRMFAPSSPEEALRMMTKGQRYRLGDWQNGLVFRVQSVGSTPSKTGGRASTEQDEEDEEGTKQAGHEGLLGVCMDREWMGDDEEDMWQEAEEGDGGEDQGKWVQVYRLPDPVLFAKATDWVSYHFSRSFLVQVPLKVAILKLRRSALYHRFLAQIYDEDSPNVAKMQAKARWLRGLERQAMRRRYTYVRSDAPVFQPPDLSIKSFIRNRIKRARKRLGERLVKLGEWTRRVNDDEYLQWQTSPDLVEVIVLWKDDPDDADEDSTVLGRVMVDVDCPLHVMREKLRRELGSELNQRHGDSYGFLDLKSLLMARKLEAKQRLKESVLTMTNEETRELERQVVIAKDKTRKKDDILILGKKAATKQASSVADDQKTGYADTASSVSVSQG